jgi:hypothetical protein
MSALPPLLLCATVDAYCGYRIVDANLSVAACGLVASVGAAVACTVPVPCNQNGLS